MQYLKRNRLLLIGILSGALGGFLYWKYAGCQSGTCMITSQPINSTIYGAVMGGLFASLFKNSVKKEPREKG